MKRSVDLDDELSAQVDQVAGLMKEKPATVIRLAIRAGLPAVSNKFQAPRPERYFAADYCDGSRATVEDSLAKALSQVPER